MLVSGTECLRRLKVNPKSSGLFHITLRTMPIRGDLAEEIYVTLKSKSVKAVEWCKVSPLLMDKSLISKSTFTFMFSGSSEASWSGLRESGPKGSSCRGEESSGDGSDSGGDASLSAPTLGLTGGVSSTEGGA